MKKKLIEGREYKEYIAKPEMVPNGKGKPKAPVLAIPDGFIGEGYPDDDGTWRGWVPCMPKKVRVKGASERQI